MIDASVRTAGSVMIEAGFRTIGGILQLLGVLFVAYELHAAIARYRGEPNVRERLRTWIVRQWRRLTGTRKGATVKAHAASAIAFGGSATLRIGARDHGSFESDVERVEYLFRRVEDAHDRIDDLRDDLAKARQEWQEKHRELGQQVKDANEEIRRTAEAIEAGSVRLRTTGFVCVLSGTVFATWSPELAETLLGLPVMLQTARVGNPSRRFRNGCSVPCEPLRANL